MVKDQIHATLARFEMIKAMNTLVKYLNDESFYDRWNVIIPDQADGDELLECAEDEELFRNACYEFREFFHENDPDEMEFFDGKHVY